MKALLATTVLSLILVLQAKSQLVTTLTLTPTQLVQNVLLGTGVTASNITFTGNPQQIARFSSTATNLGIPNGVYLSTGNASTSSPDGPQGPNGSTGTSTGWGLPGDSLLDIISGVSTNDAAILEFDFIPTGDSIRFRYCFASEEYPEYVGGGVNDAFGFFLSGPDPSGGTYVSKNIALIPGTTTPVSIDSVNAGFNAAFYRSNATNTINCEFDGFTKVLYALEKVSCGQIYHIKIAIADGGDDILDSGIFLEGGSFGSIPPITVASTGVLDSVMIEDCKTNCVYFVRTGSISLKDSFNLQVSGNAILGTDYIQQGNPSFTWPLKLVYNANQDTIRICNLYAFQDNIPETLDTVVFTITSFTTSACVSNASVKFNLYIKDYFPTVIGQNDTVICNGLGITLNAQASSGVPAYTYTWSAPVSHTPTFNTGSVSQPTTYTITVNDFCNKPVTKEILVTPSITPNLKEIGPYRICLDSVKQIPIEFTGGTPFVVIDWQAPAGGILPYDTANHVYYVLQHNIPSSGTYTIILTDQCNKKDTMVFDLSTVDCFISVPNVVTPNGDNVNDIFKINGLENFPGSSLTVFNRWGNKIYDKTDYKNDWKPDMNDGTYFYLVTVSDGRKFNGFFQVFKN